MKKVSFTGAAEDTRKGYFETGERGDYIFLDESVNYP
jgi:transcriptional regulator with PAS, ATPase and Fis domain